MRFEIRIARLLYLNGRDVERFGLSSSSLTCSTIAFSPTTISVTAFVKYGPRPL